MMSPGNGQSAAKSCQLYFLVQDKEMDAVQRLNGDGGKEKKKKQEKKKKKKEAARAGEGEHPCSMRVGGSRAGSARSPWGPVKPLQCNGPSTCLQPLTLGEGGPDCSTACCDRGG